MHITEGTYHRQFGKFAQFSMFRSWAKIWLFLSNKTIQVLIFENIHITKSYIINFLVNIWNHGKNLQDLSSQTPAKMVDCCNIWSIIMIYYIFFISKIIMQEIWLCKEKHMLTDYFSCYKLSKTSTPFPRREKFSQT